MTTAVAAHFFTVLIFPVICFQVALAVGVPWGAVTLGGKYPGVLPLNKRWIPLVSTVLLTFFVLIVEARSGYWLPEWEAFSRTAVWFVVGYCLLGILANSITPSKWERIIWLPIVTLAFVCSLVVALS